MEETTALAIVGLGLCALTFGLLGVAALAYFASREPMRREPEETVVYVERTPSGGYEIVEKEKHAQERVRFVTI